jgi:hypothetical protein
MISKKELQRKYFEKPIIGDEKWVYGYNVEINNDLHTESCLASFSESGQGNESYAACSFIIEVLCIMNLLLKVSQLIQIFSFSSETSVGLDTKKKTCNL